VSTFARQAALASQRILIFLISTVAWRHTCMTNKPKVRDMSTMSAAELREAGVPYLVDPNELMMLGLDPAQYHQTMGNWTGYMLDRINDDDLIDRLSTMRHRPMSDSLN
jgi:hypothetical protein